jgi:cytosine/adenosine deaminase-related metal-dependent hydrolase
VDPSEIHLVFGRVDGALLHPIDVRRQRGRAALVLPGDVSGTHTHFAERQMRGYRTAGRMEVGWCLGRG